MRIFTARNAAKRFGEVLDAAATEPVVIRRNGRPCAVVIDDRLYKEYHAAYEAQTEERYLSLLERGVRRLTEGRLGRGERAVALSRRLMVDIENGKVP